MSTSSPSRIDYVELAIHADVRLGPEVPLVALPALMHLRNRYGPDFGDEQLRERILDFARGSSGEEQSGMVTNIRQHEAVASAVGSLGAAVNSTRNDVPHEMILLDLYSALRSLDGLTGEITSDDILHRIFSTFCIGK